MPRKKKLKPPPEPLEPLVPRFTFGKFKGRTVDEVMRVESSYLGWFVEKIDGCEELKEAIKAHPRFPAVWESYQQCRRKIQQKAEWQQGQFSEPSIDILCDELFHEPEAEGMTRLKIIKTVHYGKYVQSGENLYCDKTGDDQYRFRVCEDGREYEPWTVTPETDLSEVPLEILEEMDTQMYYCGECDDESRDAKFSKTRKHIQQRIDELRHLSP
jgi:hypothetical protein